MGPCDGQSLKYALLRVFKKGGPKMVRTDERTDVTNGLTEYFWGLYTIAKKELSLI